MPLKTSQQKLAEGDLEIAFPVSSGAQHRSKTLVVIFLI